MDADMDLDVKNYTLAELMAIVKLDTLNPDEIISKTNALIIKYRRKNLPLAVFFQAIQSQLIHFSKGLEENERIPMDDEYEDEDEDEDDEDDPILVEGYEGMSNYNTGGEAIYPNGEEQTNEWYENQVLQQSDTEQTDKITDRKQKIDVFGNQHATMKREQIATTDTYEVPFKQDSLNPNLKNTLHRFVNLDSQFRQYTNGADFTSTNYTCNLSDTLKNTLKLSLYSYQIPFSWYALDDAYGNTCMWLRDPTGQIAVPISIPSGNYSTSEFVAKLNRAFVLAGFTFPARTSPYPELGENEPVYYDPNSGLITLYLIDGTYDGELGIFSVTEDTLVIFFDFTAELQCSVNCRNKSNHYFNNTLGWLMGFRLPYIWIIYEGNTAGAILDLNGPKYLILAIDDFNKNHLNNSLVSVSKYDNQLKIPSYYNPGIPYACFAPQQREDNLEELVTETVIQSVANDQNARVQNGLPIAGKYEKDYTDLKMVLPSAPRTLTNAQLYTINSINNNNNNLTNYLAKAPTSSDILAVIPVKTSAGVPTGSLLVEFSGSLQESQRVYFGPVDIERMSVKLLDDKGNVLNLNGSDWCVTLVAECLYQY